MASEEAVIVKMKIHPNDKSVLEQKFYVIENLTEQCILGIDFFLQIPTPK